MLKLYRSQDLKPLATKFLDVRDKSEINPLQPDLLILQNNQMKRWLQKFIAREQGVAANIKTEFPGEFIWNIYHQMDEQLPDTLPCEREPLQFAIFDLLQAGEHKKQLQPLYDYIQQDVANDSAERAWNLSTRIADLFDRYQIYRPTMILKWQQGQLQTKTTDEQWQAALWQLLHQEWNDLLEDVKWQNRAELHVTLVSAVQNGSLSIQLPEEINVFAVQTLAPAFLETFIQLGQVTGVNFYWHDVVGSKNKNELIESCGETGKEFITQFEDYVADHNLNCKFKQIKSSAQDDAIKVLSNESGLQVHSCHSPMREVQVLYDQLLDLLNNDMELEPDDILIVMPDIEPYAPLIHAVFDSPDAGQPSIPYSISGLAKTPGTCIQAFTKLLDLLRGRFKVTEVLDLLTEKSVCKKFGISEDEITQLERWVDENNIRWGIDASFKKEEGLPPSNHFTWQAGLSRMIMGTVMEPDGTKLWNEIFPYAEIAISSDAILTGKMSRFLQKIFMLHAKIEQPKSIDQWVGILHEMVQIFLPNDVTGEGELLAISRAIDKLLEQQNTTKIEQHIPFKIIQMWLQDQLLENRRSRGGLGHGITFSSMMATRSIPFKMIGMIGMNDDAFPRQDTPLGFDLMKGHSQLGDPDRLGEDRYLFLELISSAGQYGYFSYVGQSNRDEVEFPPSVLIIELLDYFSKKYNLAYKKIIQRQPLHEFSICYLKNNEIFTYSKDKKALAKQVSSPQYEQKTWLGASVATSDKKHGTILINDLIAYYQNPCKYILINRLSIILRNKKVIDEDRELFGLKGLNKYELKQILINNYLERHTVEGLEKIFDGRDQLPEGWPGKQAYKEKAKEAKEFGDRIFKKVGDEEPEDIAIDYEGDTFNLAGNISGYHSPLHFDYRFGRRRAKDLVAWWIKHVILSACKRTAEDVESVLLTWKNEELKEDYLTGLKQPQKVLDRLVDGYQKGEQEIGYFFPESSFAYVQNYEKNEDEEEALKAARKEWGGNSYQAIPGEKDDRYVKFAVGDERPLDHVKFKETAFYFWQPFFEVFNQG